MTEEPYLCDVALFVYIVKLYHNNNMTKDLSKWKLIRSEWVFYHNWYKLRRDEVRLPNDKIIDDYYVSVRPEVVIVFPITREGKVVLVHQYKHGAQDFILDFPGGLFESQEETAIHAGLRELGEETGYSTTLDKVHFLGTLYDDPTKNTNQVHLFVALDCEKKSAPSLDETEDINVYEKSLAEIKRYLIDGTINVATAIALGHKALYYYENTI